MDFDLTEEQRQVRAAFTDFGERWLTHENVEQWQQDQGTPDDVCKAFVDLCASLPELDPKRTKGGLTLAQVLVCETLARCGGTTMPFYTDLLNTRIMEQFSDSPLVAPLLDDYRKTGRLAFSMAVTEPTAGSDTMGMRCQVHAEDGIVYLDGSKTFVVNGEYAPNLLVAAVDADVAGGDRPALSFWLVPRRLPGVSAYPVTKVGQSMLPFADVVFDHVPLTPDRRLRSEALDGFPQLFHMFEIGRVMVCADSLGLAQAAMGDAVRYAKRREVFGHRLADFQQIEQMLVDMQVKIDNMRSMTYRAAWDMDRRAPGRRLSAALMKRYVPRAGTEVASDAMQILGGRGYTDKERVSWIWRDCRGNQISEGTDQIMVRIAAPHILALYGEDVDEEGRG